MQKIETTSPPAGHTIPTKLTPARKPPCFSFIYLFIFFLLMIFFTFFKFDSNEKPGQQLAFAFAQQSLWRPRRPTRPLQ